MQVKEKINMPKVSFWKYLKVFKYNHPEVEFGICLENGLDKLTNLATKETREQAAVNEKETKLIRSGYPVR